MRDGKEDSMSHVDEGTLHAYLDNELPPGERASVEAHLAQCPTCRALLAEERALLERSTALLASARPVERPVPPFEQVRRAPRRRPWYLRTPVAWAASIVLAVGIGYYLREPDNSPPPAIGAADERIGQQDSNAAAAAPEQVATRKPAPTREAQRRAQEQKTEPQEEAERDKGAVALEPNVQLRNATPTPVAAAVTPKPDSLRLDAAIVVSGAKAQSGEVAALRGRAVTTQWQIISHGAATTLLGTDLVGLPGLRTRRIRRSPAPEATVVVEQALDSTTTIQIFQRTMSEDGYADRLSREAPRSAAAPAPAQAPADRLARFVGRLRVEISGPLTTDSLNKLLEQVEPIP